MSAQSGTTLTTAERALVETNGIEVIDEAERTAKPSDLFWPWFAANVSVFGISYSSFVYGFGVGLALPKRIVVLAGLPPRPNSVSGGAAAGTQTTSV